MKNANISTITRGKVLGFPVAASSPKRVAHLIAAEALVTRNPCLISFADVEVMARAAHYDDFGAVMKVYDLICPDSVPVVWMLHDGRTVAERTAMRLPAVDIMAEVLKMSAKVTDLKHFFLGGSPEMLMEIEKNVRAMYPGINIAGTYSPPFTEIGEAESRDIADVIQESEANIVWVALGCPKQEKWMARHVHVLTPAVYLTVGTAFAILSGEEKPAPQWMQKMGLEWVLRVVHAPRRFLYRYIRWNVLFLYYALRGKGK